jgi:hypothetical protein
LAEQAPDLATPLLQQRRQRRLHGLPHHIQVDVKVAVGDAVPHAPHAAPGNLGVCCDELGIAVHHLRGGFANDDEAHDDRLLGALVRQEIVFGQPLHEAARIHCGLLQVIHVVREAVLGAHTGRACANT